MGQHPRELNPARSPRDLFGAQLRSLRETSALSQAALAARIHVTAAAVGTWEKGRSLPDERTAAALDAALGSPGILLAAWRLAARDIEPGDVVPTAENIERLRQRLDTTLSAGAMTGAALDDWDAAVARYATASKDRSPAELVGDLAADIEQLRHLLDRPRPVTVARHLTRATAQMAGLMTLALVKQGWRQPFRSWARIARVAAEESGDPETCSWVLAQEAYGHYYSGDHGHAIAIAQLAQDRTRSVPRVGAALAAALEGRAHAALGDRDGCQVALGRAETILGHLAAGDGELSALGYTEGALRFHQGNALTLLHDTAAAWTVQQRALELCAPADYMDRTLTRLDRAACLAFDGDAEAAARFALDAVAPLTGQQCGGIIAGRGREVLAAIGERRRALPAVAELRERLSMMDGDG